METSEADTAVTESSAKARPSLFVRLWPVITNEEEAQKFAKSGAYAAATVAVLTSAISLIALGAKKPVLGMDGWGIVDALLFAVIAWRMFKFSFPWAVVGLLLYCAEMAWKWSTGGFHNVVVPAFIILALIAGMRGTAFLSKKEKLVGPIIFMIFAIAFAMFIGESVHP